MTGPVENITVRCPACGAIYEDWHRGSLNLDLDSFQRGLHSLRHDRDVPGVRDVVELGVLIVEGDVWMVR